MRKIGSMVKDQENFSSKYSQMYDVEIRTQKALKAKIHGLLQEPLGLRDFLGEGRKLTRRQLRALINEVLRGY